MHHPLDPKHWTDDDIADLLSRRPIDRMERALQDAAREEAERRKRIPERNQG